MSTSWDDESLGEDDVIFVFQEDPECRSASKLKDVRIGEQFVFRGEVFTKRNDYGWHLGVCNIADVDGNVSHLHPTTAINLLQ